MQAMVDKLMQDPRNRIVKVAWGGGGLLEIDWSAVAPLDLFNPTLSGLPITMPLEHGMPLGVINIKASNINLPSISSVPIEQIVTDKMLSEYIQWTNAPPSSSPAIVGLFPGGSDTYVLWLNRIPEPTYQQPPDFQGVFQSLNQSGLPFASLAEAEQYRITNYGKIRDDPQFGFHALTIKWPTVATISTETRASYLFNLSKLAALMPVDPATGLKPPTLTFEIRVPYIVSKRDINSYFYPLARSYRFTFRTYKKTHRNFTTGLGPSTYGGVQRGETVGSTPRWDPAPVPTGFPAIWAYVDGGNTIRDDGIAKQARSGRSDFLFGIQQGIKAIKWTITIDLKTLEITDILEES